MVAGKLRLGLAALAITSAVAVQSMALAHTVLVSPPPRDVGAANADQHKNGPCGGVARAGTPTKYAPGATVTVKWKETVSHEGCFQIGFSAANDANFTVLKQIPDPASGAGMVYTDTVTLPAGVSCPSCTLVVRQIMLDSAGTKTCAPNMVPPSAGGDAGSTYYSCADICVGDACTESDAGTPTDAGLDSSTPGKDSGVGTTPTDGGGKLVDAGKDDDDGAAPNLRSGDGGGCSVALGATTGVGFSAAAGLLGLALLRRRRPRKN